MTASIDAMARTLTARSIKGLPRGSGLLSLRFEERALHDRCGRPMPFPLDRHLDLDARAGPGVRRGDGGNRDVPLQQGRPATARGPADLTIARIQGYLLPPRLGRRLWRQPHVPIETFHRLPIDLETDRPPRGTASPFLEERLPPDERTLSLRDGPVQTQLQRRVHLRGDDRLPRGPVFDLRQDEPGLNPREVEGEHPGRGDVMAFPFLHDGVPQRLGPFALDPDLVSEIARIARPGDVDRDPVELRLRESKVLEFLDRAIGPFEHDRTGGRALQGERPDVLWNVFHSDVESHAGVLKPLQIRLRGGHPEGTVSEGPEGAVVDRLPAFIAPRRVVDLPLREFRGIARDDLVHELEGILPADEIFVERGDVEESRGMADRVVLHLRDEGIRRCGEGSGPAAPFPAVADR